MIPESQNKTGPAGPALSCQAVRDGDRQAIDRLGIPGVVLMENAGRCGALLAAEMLGNKPAGECRVLIVAGTGNNGGDGFVVARHLDRLGAKTGIVVCGTQDKVQGDALINLRIVQAMGLTVEFYPAAAVGDLEQRILQLGSDADLVVDGMLGTGLTGPPRQPFAAAIQAVNRLGRPVLALDIPSGLNGDTGEAYEPTVRALRTITFAALKPGLLMPQAAAFAGQVVVGDIGIHMDRLLE